MTFAVPKCPILVVCAAAMCFISKVDPNDYFLPSILFKEKHGNSRYGSMDLINHDDDANGWSNNNLRIGVQENDGNNRKKDETAKKLEKFVKAGKQAESKADGSKKDAMDKGITKKGTKDSESANKTTRGSNSGEGSKSSKKQERKPEAVASVSSSRNIVEVEVVVAKSVEPNEKNKKTGGEGGGDAKKSQSKKGGESSQLRKKKESPKRTGKPLFILHIGPPKTGTTTLQCELGEKFQVLKEENFYYLGFYHPPLCELPETHVVEGFSDVTRKVLLRCYSSHNSDGCDLEQQWKEFEDILMSHKDHNVIMSDEMFHHHFEKEDVKRMAKILNPHWDVRIMYTYRHLYSSVPSFYQQINDPYATQKGMPHAHEKTIWPEDGGYKILPFRESNHFDSTQEMKQFNTWADSFNWVQVFNMQNTEGGDYLPEFLCTMIPESKALCQDAKNTDASDHKDNDSSSKYLHFDMLAVEAHEQGLLKDSKKTREEVRDAVQEFCQSKGWSFQHFPLECLSEPEMESFLNESLKQAHTLQPYFVNPREDSSTIDSIIRSGFQSYREKKKFCSVNTKRTLEEHPWRQFFLKLE